MFCSNCGTKIEKAVKFCSNCGSAVAGTSDLKSKTNKTVSLLPAQRRIAYASFDLESVDPATISDDAVQFDANSEEAKNANAPFNSKKIPKEGDLVPLNCVWAFVKHPGKFPSDPGWGAIDKKFIAMGTLRGRTFDEIVAVVGAPMTVLNTAAGSNAVWGKTGFLSMWQIGLNFDPYGVCMGVFSESSF